MARAQTVPFTGADIREEYLVAYEAAQLRLLIAKRGLFSRKLDLAMLDFGFAPIKISCASSVVFALTSTAQNLRKVAKLMPTPQLKPA